ncbi:DUF2293 domain-containing protein [Plebeiibacterium marinum]|uniref:DUF2293 domain-containing protein n=1 Tax=Plebeiibacterium marinum TaxID=2992111 RepID=A0AAE3MDN7_9BACT|nr:DUF2293 domain-containing protein [Plebeiobacterium marinum]MCW3805701.1 DUF2293 domain-containing protein [Plebeiobacterium marinum]
MSHTIRTLTISSQGSLIDERGSKHTPPANWSFLPAGDAGITRKVTSKGIYWKVVFKKGRRTMSKGVWAPMQNIDIAIKEVQAKRNTAEYQKQKIYNQQRRDKQQQEYEGEFCRQVEIFLNFHPQYQLIAKTVAILVTKHAIPVGSGTVARTAMIPIEERAGKAVVAWMRHQTTGYDDMHIPKIKGERRNVRRNLAHKSISTLEVYRKGIAIPGSCPLKRALEKLTQAK